MLSKIVKRLDKATAGSEQNPVDLDDPMDVDESESDPDPESYETDSDPEPGGWSPRSPQHQTQVAVAASASDLETAKHVQLRIRELGLIFKPRKKPGFALATSEDF